MDKVQHFEIPTDDLARARGFYEAVFGWKTTEYPMPNMAPYVGLTTGSAEANGTGKEAGFINGGMFERGKDFPITAPTIAVVVPDLDAALEKVRANGGTVYMEKKDVGGMGLYAYVKDTEGNIIGVWQDTVKKE